MRRIFIRLWISIVACLVIEILLVVVLVLPGFNKKLSRNIENAVAAPIAVIADMMAAGPAREADLQQMLAAMRKRMAMPVALVARTELELSPDESARLDRGETIGTGFAPYLIILSKLTGTDRVLRVGPVVKNHPLSEGRGISIILIVFLGLSIGVYLPMRRLRRRFSSLSVAVDELGRGKLDARASTEGGDALAEVGVVFNRMATDLGRALEGQRELLHMVSHELRLPLQRLNLGIDLLTEGSSAKSRADGLRHVRQDLDELEHLVNELLDYVRLNATETTAPPLCELRPHLRELVEQATLAVGPALSQRLPEGSVAAHIDPTQFRRAVGNLLSNAVRHARTQVRLSVSWGSSASTPQNRPGEVCLEVEDDGPGIPEKERERVFEPFQRLAQAHNPTGTGLGLAIVRRIAERHGGRVEVLESALGGARLRFTLPAPPAQPQRQAA